MTTAGRFVIATSTVGSSASPSGPGRLRELALAARSRSPGRAIPLLPDLPRDSDLRCAAQGCSRPILCQSRFRRPGLAAASMARRVPADCARKVGGLPALRLPAQAVGALIDVFLYANSRDATGCQPPRDAQLLLDSGQRVARPRDPSSAAGDATRVGEPRHRICSHGRGLLIVLTRCHAGHRAIRRLPRYVR
jgi:hypothetical protein